MAVFDPEKLLIMYLPPASYTYPAEGRKYTVTHSDQTGEIRIQIGTRFDETYIQPKLRDEVLAEWQYHMGQYRLRAQVHISSGDFDRPAAGKRFFIFEREMKLALTALVHADAAFLGSFPWLLNSPVVVEFESIYPEYSGIKEYGTVRSYL